MHNLLKTPFFRKFIIAFGVTFLLVSSLAVGVYATMRTWVSAPEVAAQQVVVVQQEPPAQSTSNPSQSPSGSSEEEPAPESEFEGDLPGVLESVLMDRKPYFFTFLLFGIDTSNQVDAIMVGSIDAMTSDVNLISIPRDTLVDVNRRVRKISNSYASGRFGGRDHDSGVNQVKTEVSRLIGFRPDFYVMADFEGFERIVDAIGGITIDIPFHMRNTDPFQNLFIDLLPGEQLLSGEQALHFARFRESDSGFRPITDYQRMENQQHLLAALFNELLSPGTILRLPEFVRIYTEHVNTDLTYGEIIWFARRVMANGLDLSSIDTHTLPIRGTSGAPYWYEIPDRAGILELVNRTVNPFQQDIIAGMLRIIEP